jgi:hypothetical protein
LQQKPDTKVKGTNKCKIVGIYEKNRRISGPLARSSTNSSTEGTMEEGAMDKKRKKYKKRPKKVNKAQVPNNWNS